MTADWTREEIDRLLARKRYVTREEAEILDSRIAYLVRFVGMKV